MFERTTLSNYLESRNSTCWWRLLHIHWALCLSVSHCSTKVWTNFILQSSNRTWTGLWNRKQGTVPIGTRGELNWSRQLSKGWHQPTPLVRQGHTVHIIVRLHLENRLNLLLTDDCLSRSIKGDQAEERNQYPRRPRNRASHDNLHLTWVFWKQIYFSALEFSF